MCGVGTAPGGGGGEEGADEAEAETDADKDPDPDAAAAATRRAALRAAAGLIPVLLRVMRLEVVRDTPREAPARLAGRGSRAAELRRASSGR